jgi:hypothetical protein
VRRNFPALLVIDAAGFVVTHIGLGEGQHHMASWATMRPLGNIAELPQTALEENDERQLVLSRDAAGDAVALGTSSYHKDLERPA